MDTQVTEETRLEAYKKSDDEIKNLYESPSSGEIMIKIYEKYLTPETNYRLYASLIGDVILGFHKTTDLPRLFQSQLNISADEAQRMTADLLEFLSPVLEREENEKGIKKEEIDKLAQTFKEATEKRPAEITPEGKPEDIKPLRTMAADMNRAHGYGSQTNNTDEEEPIVKSEQAQTLGQAAPTPPAPVSKPATPTTPPTSLAASTQPTPVAENTVAPTPTTPAQPVEETTDNGLSGGMSLDSQPLVNLADKPAGSEYDHDPIPVPINSSLKIPRSQTPE